jgi:hypothetical protein
MKDYRGSPVVPQAFHEGLLTPLEAILTGKRPQKWYFGLN